MVGWNLHVHAPTMPPIFVYLLTAIAVSFARDDALRESIADSGNRVMLQVTLLAFFASAMRVISLTGNDGTAENDKNITEQEENSNG